MPHIQVIEHNSAQGRLKEIYDEIIAKRGKLAEVHKIQSLNPETIVHHMDLYMSIMYSKSPLSRAEREMMGVVVSITNGCAYCAKHHQEALNAYWKNTVKVQKLGDGFNEMDLPAREHALCSYAKELTKTPSSFGNSCQIKPLRDVGLDDRAILDATLVVGYFNFVNRIVLSLGVELESDMGSGYKY